MIATFNALRKDLAVVGFFFIMVFLALSLFMYIKIKLYEETHRPVYPQATYAVELI